jgi:myxalamid-type polyketide synthase MxaE and MxaD
VLSDVRFAAAWWLVEGREAPAQVVVAPADGGGVLLRVASEDGGWRVHATARARVEAVAAPAGVVPGEVAARCGEALAVESMYAELAARGLHYGPRFRGVLAARRRDGEALVEVRPGPAGEVLDAAVLDACLQAFAAAAPRGGDGRTFVPAGIGRFWLRAGAAGEVRLAHATVTSVDEDELRGRVVLAGADGAALGVADELVARAVQPEREARIRAAMFATAWRPAPLPEGDPRGAFLVLGGEDDVGAALAARLRAAGARVTTVGSAPAAVERAGLAGAWRAVIVAWPATTAGPLDADGLAAAAARGPAALLRVAQELGAQARRDPPRLWCVTAGALATTDGEAVAPEQATVWGLRRSLAHELPELRCAAADVGARWGAAEVEGLARLVASETLEDEWALRGGRALVSRLSPRTGGGAGRWRARADRSYVVTGGLGGLGRVTAAWLVERGARHLALVGRGAPSAAAAAELAGLRARGVQVEVVQADVADPAGWAAAAARISAALPRVAGVFHAAGALDDGLARAQTPARLAAVMRPKVEGSAHLHAFACAQESEVFVMFASSAGLLGPVGQATYAAANAFEDALAQRRRAEGRHALAVDWGPWAEVGQAAAQVAAGAFAGQGLQAIAPADGLRALEILLAEDATHAAVLPIDGRRFQESQLASRAAPRLSELVEGGAPAGPGGAGEDLRARLRAAPPERRREALAAVVRAQIGEALKLPPARVPADGPLSELGIDSLTSLAVRNRLEACTGLRLSATVLWNYPTPAAIAEHLAERLGVAEAPAPAPVPDEAARLLGELVGEAAALDVAALQALLGEREG